MPQQPLQENSTSAGEQASDSAATAAASASPAPAEPAEPEAVDAQEGLPTECYTQGELCLPPPTFVDRLCRAAHVGTAIRLFAKGSPFTRAYVRMREVRALNLRGGPSGGTQLTFAEEVLLLHHHGTAGELEVSGDGGYDVLRWDGTCATLSSDELVTRVPAPPRHAPFAWKYIDDGVQAALLRNSVVRSAWDAERKRCRGASDSEQSAACRAAAEQLNDRVVVAIRSGIDLPVPEYTP
ncbi:MAG TPA: hypothetical protein VJU61_09840 [Polyangiaceae bacterium]|nr:hypothetical protein [Polyangiaceae bacterium]